MTTTLPQRLRTLWFFLRTHRWLYGVLLVVMVSYAVLESISISALFPLLELSLSPEPSTTGGVFGFLGRVVRWLPFRDPFLGACLIAVMVLLVKEGMALLRKILTSYGASTVVCETREAVFTAYLHRPFEFFLGAKQGDLLYNTIQAPGKLGNCLQYTLEMITAAFMTITLGLLLLSISWQVTALLMAVAFGFNLVTQLLATKVSYHLGHERVTIGRAMEVAMNESLDGIKHIKTYGAFALWRQRFAQLVRRFKHINIRDETWLAVPERALNMLPVMMLVGVALAGRHLHRLHPEQMVSHLSVIGIYALAFYRLVPFLTSFGRYRMQIMGTFPDVELLYELLRHRPDTERTGGINVSGVRADIHFEQVRFRYQGKPDDVLHDLTFTIEPGKTTAIVGPSGAGKSTIAHLLTRLFEPREGRITIDGVDLRAISSTSLSQLIGLVSQEPFVFHGSVAENILFGLDHVPFERLVAAARAAHAHEFISRLPQGYDTVVGDKGLKLSGGQRQRIAIARALLRQPAVLVLDEATSALDYQSELVVQRALNAVARGRTVVVIAHRLSTIRQADKIVVLDHGRIVEEGTHAELMQRNGMYRALYEHQERDVRPLEPDVVEAAP